MIEEYNFSFNELVINRLEIEAMMGYPDSILPEPFNQYMEEVLHEAKKFIDIRATFRVVEDIIIDQKNGTLLASEQKFNVGKMICKELAGSVRIALFVCSAGKTISEKSADLFKSGDPILGYIYDLLGSAIVEAAGDLIQSKLKLEALRNGEDITNRYSPGYCNWSTSEQHKLFTLFNEAPSGVTLSQSALMNPVKSISGLIGIGKGVKYRSYQCDLCRNKDCVYRKIRKNK